MQNSFQDFYQNSHAPVTISLPPHFSPSAAVVPNTFSTCELFLLNFKLLSSLWGFLCRMEMNFNEFEEYCFYHFREHNCVKIDFNTKAIDFLNILKLQNMFRCTNIKTVKIFVFWKIRIKLKLVFLAMNSER